MAHRFGLFDVDNRELDESGRGLAYRPRVGPIVPLLERLYALAEVKCYPVVLTTCCSGRPLSPGALSDTLFVPLDGGDVAWRAGLGSHRRFILEKRSYGNPAANFACRAFDMFQDNANAARLMRELDVETWVAFGNGFDLCVGSAARGILDAGLPLIVLEDVRVSSAAGTPESEAETLRELRARGARTMSLDAFFDLAEHP